MSNETRPMDEAMQAYSLAQLQTFRNMLITLDRNELTIDQFLRYMTNSCGTFGFALWSRKLV
jgi:hypothetical protein